MSWKKCEKDDETCIYIKGNMNKEFHDKPFPYLYTGEYISNAGYAPKTNDLIINFKMGGSVAENRVTYRTTAIQEVAKKYNFFFNNLNTFFGLKGEGITREEIVVILPPNNRQDDRFIQTLKEIMYVEQHIILKFKSTEKPLHEGGDRDPRKIQQNIEIEGKHIQEQEKIKYWFYLDDVITSGATFNAVSHFLQEQGLGIKKVYGLFIAKTI